MSDSVFFHIFRFAALRHSSTSPEQKRDSVDSNTVLPTETKSSERCPEQQ